MTGWSFAGQCTGRPERSRVGIPTLSFARFSDDLSHNSNFFSHLPPSTCYYQILQFIAYNHHRLPLPSSNYMVSRTYHLLISLYVSSAALMSRCGSSSLPALHSWPFRGLPLSNHRSEALRSYLVAILRHSLPSGRVRGLKPLALVFWLEMYAAMRISYNKIMNAPGGGGSILIPKFSKILRMSVFAHHLYDARIPCLS